MASLSGDVSRGGWNVSQRKFYRRCLHARSRRCRFRFPGDFSPVADRDKDVVGINNFNPIRSIEIPREVSTQFPGVRSHEVAPDRATCPRDYTCPPAVSGNTGLVAKLRMALRACICELHRWARLAGKPGTTCASEIAFIFEPLDRASATVRSRLSVLIWL